MFGTVVLANSDNVSLMYMYVIVCVLFVKKNTGL